MKIPFLSRFFEKRSALNDPNSWLFKTLGYRPTYSGVNVTEESALNATAVFASVRLLSGTIASLPLPVYRRLKPRGKERASEHLLYRILHDRPNPELSSFRWRQTGMAHQLLWGNEYSEIEFDSRGNVVALWPIPPWRVTPQRSAGGLKYYEITLPEGGTKKLPHYQVLHIMNLSLDGMKGLSCIAAGRQAIGLALAAEECGAKLFGQGLNPGGVVTYPGKVNPESLEELKEDMKEKFSGLGKIHRLLFLEEGMKYDKVGIPPNDAQFLETRQFQVAEIGRLFGISQLHKIGDLARATFSNIEEQNIDFVVDAIRPHLVNREQEYNWQLFSENERGEYFTEFNLDALLRGNTQMRWEAYNKGFMIGGFSVNDILELENRNPIGPEGEVRFVPMNLVPLELAVDPPEPPEPPEPDTNEREYRSAANRTKLANAYKRIFEDAAKRIIKRERADIMRAAEKILGERNNQVFFDFLDDFYKKHPDYVRKQILPPIHSLAEAIQAAAAGEVDISAGMTPELEKFVQEYADTYISRHINRSQGQLQAIVQNAWEEGLDPVDVLNERFDEWEEKRPGKIATEETVRVAGAVARFVFAGAGITRLMWVNTGSKSCPFCEQLNGKVVGIEQPFITAEGNLEANDGSGMKVYGPKLHPPIHSGCTCQIVASK